MDKPLKVKQHPRIAGLARCTVVDDDGLQAWPKPGRYETAIACQRFIERYEARKVVAMREP